MAFHTPHAVHSYHLTKKNRWFVHNEITQCYWKTRRLAALCLWFNCIVGVIIVFIRQMWRPFIIDACAWSKAISTRFHLPWLFVLFIKDVLCVFVIRLLFATQPCKWDKISVNILLLYWNLNEWVFSLISNLSAF